MVLFNINKYLSHKDIVDNKLIAGECKLYICRKCHNESQLKFQCICCCRHVNKSVCTEYVPNNYDFLKYIVSQSLGNINSDFQGNRYICLQCHNKLIGTTNENPIMPFHTKNTLMKAGANFLKSLDERPEHVCTCCHWMLFQKTVRLFKTSQYDQTNEVVQKCLSHHFILKVKQKSVYNDALDNDNSQWLNFVYDDNADGTTVVFDEFICTHCRNALHSRKPRMPDQACANGLKVYDIPQELKDIYPIER